ncbi:hypothetical protein EST38_g2848 [Candolleomyces aberdarensis]|uniref:F-box domain-containing protein n=1 Tax=Candolleomyces aberdarensis TaxID=2316362 RepID=A0A4Q2DTI9_9AGAR|nr:hypothetical protein EST38_g2848 [Candolleomyces aberdarensis]
MSVRTTPESKRTSSSSSSMPSQTASRFAKYFAEIWTLKSPQDEYDIRQIIDRHRASIIRIDIELASKSSSPGTDLESLKSQRAEHMEALENHCRLLSPIERVPADLLRMIFLHCLPDIDERDPQVFANDAPYVLLEVCKLWGAVASGYPSLWNRIVIKPPTNGSSSEQHMKFSKQTAAILAWISRSGDLPLYVYINDWRSPSDAFLEGLIIDFFADALSDSIHRWKEICGRIDLESCLFISVLECRFARSCDRAERRFNEILDKERKEGENTQDPTTPPKKWELTLSRIAVTVDVPPKNERPYWLNWRTERRSQRKHQLWHVQSLRALELPVMPIVDSIKDILPFWSGLTTLWNVWATPIEVYHILKGCPNLEIAGFACPAFRRPRTGSGQHKFKEGYALSKSERIEAQVLRKVSFYNYPQWNLNPLCSVVDFSAVSDLTLVNTRCEHRRKNKCSRRPHRIISDLGPRLTKVHFEHVCISAENMLSYLKQLTNVTRLSILYPPGKSTKDGKFYYHKGVFDSSHLEKITPSIPNAFISNDPTLNSVDKILEQAEKFEGPLLPKLTSLICDFLYHSQGPNFEEDDILKFIQARRKPSSALSGVVDLEELVFKCQVISTTSQPDDDEASGSQKEPTVKNLTNTLQRDVDVEGLRATGTFRYVPPVPLGNPQAKPRREREGPIDHNYSSDFEAIPGGSIPSEYLYTPEGSEWGDSERDSEVTEAEEEEEGGWSSEDEHEDTQVEVESNQSFGGGLDGEDEFSEAEDEGWDSDDESTDDENEESKDERED